jgi:hypothetical protein
VPFLSYYPLGPITHWPEASIPHRLLPFEPSAGLYDQMWVQRGDRDDLVRTDQQGAGVSIEVTLLADRAFGSTTSLPSTSAPFSTR